MLEIVGGNINLCDNLIFLPLKCNRMWGVEYLLMDSSSFMHDSVIDILVNIRTTNKSITEPVASTSALCV